MRTVRTKDKLEFVFAMGRHSAATIHDIQRLMRYGATLGNIAEAHCNGDCPYNPHDYDGTGRDCPKQERIEKKVIELCEIFGAKPVFQQDPRGCVLKIQVPDGYTNDWGREGICVPTS
jgi:hypothetical protein